MFAYVNAYAPRGKDVYAHAHATKSNTAEIIGSGVMIFNICANFLLQVFVQFQIMEHGL